MPIVVLEEADLRRRLRDVLAELDERDSVLPTRALKIRNPLVVFSGLNSVELSATLRTVSPALRASREYRRVSSSSTTSGCVPPSTRRAVRTVPSL